MKSAASRNSILVIGILLSGALVPQARATGVVSPSASQGTSAEGPAEVEKGLQAAIADTEGSNPAQLPGAVTNLAKFYRENGRYAEAEALYSKVVELTRAHLTDDPASYAHSLNNLAVFYHDRGEYDRAKPLYQESLRIEQGMAEPNRADIAGALLNLSQLYEDLHDTPAAVDALAQVKTLWESNQAVSDDQAAEVLLQLADLSSQGDQARALRADALDLWEKGMPEADARDLQRLLRVGQAFRDEGDKARAERSYNLVMAHWQDANAPSEAVAAAANLGEIYMIRSDYADSEAMYKTALQIGQTLPQPDGLELAANLSGAAMALSAEGKFAEAAPLYQRAAELREERLGPDDPAVIQSLLFYASCLRSNGDRQAAQQVQERAVRLTTKPF
jgi:tetratricopeptide (TPR) repeat protein